MSDFPEGTFARQTKEKHVFLFQFARLFVPLASPKVLSLDKTKEKRAFLLFCARLFVPLSHGNEENHWWCCKDPIPADTWRGNPLVDVPRV